MWIKRKAVQFYGFHPVVRRYVLEAVCYLVAARLALRLIPFRRLTGYFKRPPENPESSYARRIKAWQALAEKDYVPRKDMIIAAERQYLCSGISWLIGEADGFLPGTSACFARAIAAQVILRRLGIATSLFYGAATLSGDDHLTAHVWLQAGDIGIIGHENAGDYHVLAVYASATP